jgi:hypothetical protein
MKHAAADILSMAGKLFMKGLKFLICPNKGDAGTDTTKEGAKAQGTLMKWLCEEKKGIVSRKDDKGAVAQGLMNAGKGINAEITGSETAHGKKGVKEDPAVAKAKDAASAKKALVDGPLKACMKAKNCLSVFKSFIYDLWDAQIVAQVRTGGAEVNINFPLEGGNLLKGLIEVVTDTAGVSAVAQATTEFFVNLVAKIRAVIVGIIKDMFDIFSKLGDFAAAKAKEFAAGAAKIGKKGMEMLGKGAAAAQKFMDKMNPFKFSEQEVRLLKELRKQHQAQYRKH